MIKTIKKATHFTCIAKSSFYFFLVVVVSYFLYSSIYFNLEMCFKSSFTCARCVRFLLILIFQLLQRKNMVLTMISNTQIYRKKLINP